MGIGIAIVPQEQPRTGDPLTATLAAANLSNQHSGSKDRLRTGP